MYKASLSLRDFIKSTEGFLRGTYVDGHWIVGYGHVVSDGTKQQVSYKEADDLLDLDLRLTETILDISGKTFSQSQVDAACLLGFYYPTLLKKFLDTGTLPELPSSIPTRIKNKLKTLLCLQ